MEKPREKLHHYNSQGHAHELTFSCFRRRDHFCDPVVCEMFLDELGKGREIYGFSIWAYVLMPNHVHMLIWPKEAVYDIAKIESGTKGFMSKRYHKSLRR